MDASAIANSKIIRKPRTPEIVIPEFDDLPRVGVLWTLAARLETLRYFGLDPQENYPDRQSGALLGVHGGAVSSQFFPYVMPQETGHHGGTRWVELSSADGRRLRFEFETPLGFSALHFTPEMLFAAKKQTDLDPAPETFLSIDAAHRGLGSGSCGPDTLPEYRTGPRPHEWSYRVRFFCSGPYRLSPTNRIGHSR